MGGGGNIPIVSDLGRIGTSIFPEIPGAIIKEIPGLRGVGQTMQDIGRDDLVRDIVGLAAIAAGGYGMYGAMHPAELAAAAAESGTGAAGSTAAAASGSYVPSVGAGGQALVYGSPEYTALGGTTLPANLATGLVPASGTAWGWGLPTLLLGTNLASQYVGSNAQRQAAEELMNIQLGAQQSYYNQQKADIEAANAKTAESIRQAQADALTNWRENAFPSGEAISAATNAANASLNQQLQTAKQRFFEESAGRGIKAPMASGLAEIESGSLATKAKMLNEIAQFANTPYSAPPIGNNYMTYNYPGMPSAPTPGAYTPWQTGLANTISGLTGTIGGLSTYGWLKKQYPTLFA